MMSPDDYVPHRCQARHGRLPHLQCLGESSRATTHIEDHWAVDRDGQTVRWEEMFAMYPGRDESQNAELAFRAARGRQVGGDHYSRFKIQVWDIIDEYELSYYEGQILKYLLRRKADRLEDLKKARHVLDKLIEVEEGKDG